MFEKARYLLEVKLNYSLSLINRAQDFEELVRYELGFAKTKIYSNLSNFKYALK